MLSNKIRILFLILIAAALAACTNNAKPATPTSDASLLVDECAETDGACLAPTSTGEVPGGGLESPLATPGLPAAQDEPAALRPTEDTRLLPEEWQTWPVIPAVSARAREIHQTGLLNGTNPKAFSVIGDCQNVSSKFLGPFDTGDYTLGAENAHLQDTIDYFEGQWSRESQAVRGGFNVASVLSPTMADPDFCEAGETPLDCEFRINNPGFVIISMEQWWSKRPAEVYEGYLRDIVDYSITRGVLPILSTKADNLEGDHAINAAVARVAYDYDLPVWNFWLEVQPLEHHGLWDDGFHLTVGLNNFDDPLAMRYAWPHRNLTALQVIDAVWRAVSQ